MGLPALLQALGAGLYGLLATPTRRCPFCGETYSFLPLSARQDASPELPIWFPWAGCPRCLSSLPFVVPPFCQRCGRPLRQTSAPICANCRYHQHFFAVARAVGVYDGALRHWIQLLKYADRVEIASGLGVLMGELALLDPVLQAVEVVVPVPVSPERQRERGYNQAELLARPLADRLGLPVAADALLRNAGGISQSLLTGDARRRNAFGLYAMGRPAGVAGRRVLLVDDILTTAATANEVSRLLLKAGALEVKVIVAAVGVQRTDWARAAAGAGEDGERNQQPGDSSLTANLSIGIMGRSKRRDVREDLPPGD